MRIELDYDENELKKASGSYLEDADCYEVEIIKNENADTLYRIELIDNDYIDVTIHELSVLKKLLNNPTVTKKLDLEREE